MVGTGFDKGYHDGALGCKKACDKNKQKKKTRESHQASMQSAKFVIDKEQFA